VHHVGIFSTVNHSLLRTPILPYVPLTWSPVLQSDVLSIHNMWHSQIIYRTQAFYFHRVWITPVS